MGQVEFRVATEFNVVKVKVSAEAEQRIKELQEAGCCLGCKKKIEPEDRVRRGLCDTCYSGMRHAVKKRRTTENKLIAEGELLPPAQGGRRPANEFTKKLNAKE